MHLNTFLTLVMSVLVSSCLNLNVVLRKQVILWISSFRSLRHQIWESHAVSSGLVGFLGL